MNRFLLAQVTDMHIKAGGRLSYRVVDTERFLERCIDQVLAMPQAPDAVIFTGDLTDFGRVEEYANLHRLIAPLPMPALLLPGNVTSTRSAASTAALMAPAEVPQMIGKGHGLFSGRSSLNARMTPT